MKLFPASICKIFFLLSSLLLLSNCSSKPYVITQTDISIELPQAVYIVNHGWHNGLVIPSKSIMKQLPLLQTRFNNTPYIEFGWGDRRFYQAKEVTFGMKARAILWPTDSVIHAAAVPESPDDYFPNSKLEKLCLDAEQYALLITFLKSSFLTESGDNIIPLVSGIYGDSQFYKAEGDYYLFNTCNTWIAKALKSARFDISTSFKFSAESIMDYLADLKTSSTNSNCKL